MKKIFSFLLLGQLLLLTVKLNAQNWVNGGNNLTATGRLGTTSSQSVAFITNNTERGRVSSSGNWGFGTSSPTDKVHINSASGSNPFRVQVNGSTKFLVHSSGGVSVGSSSTPPSNGLHVNGNVGIGTTSPTAKLHVVGSSSSGTGIYVQGYSYGINGHATYTYGTAVYGTTDQGYAVYGSSNYIGVFGNGGSTYGTYGYSYSGTAGAYGYSNTGIGVKGYSNSSFGGDFTSYSGTALNATATTGFYAAIFNGNTFTYGTNYTTSDRNIKKNIQEVGNAMSIINKLKPKNYEFRNDGKYASLNLPKGNHYGLIAQELEEVLPNLVTETPYEVKTSNQPVAAIIPGANGISAPIVSEPKQAKEIISIKGVNYTELIPIIVKAMQEQQATIEKQNARIEALTLQVNQLVQNKGTDLSVKLSGASLGQATPNPNSNNAKISYNIPGAFSKAGLVITNEAGQVVKQLQLTKSGLINLDTSKLHAGTYFYTMSVDGVSVDTKKMVVNR